MSIPVITIFVRPASDCKYEDAEFTKRCNCLKHLHWTQNGMQFQRKTGSRSWTGVEDANRRLEDQLADRKPEDSADGLLLVEAIETFD